MSSQTEVSVLPVTVLHGAPAGDGFSAQTVRGGAYLAARYGLGVLVSLGNMLVMTWWIGPHAYGLFVTAIGLVAFLAAVARGGIDTYLVRSEAPPDTGMYGAAITLILGASVSLGLAAAAMTPLLVRWYGSREFVGPYLVLLATVPLSALTGIPIAKLERALDFRRIAGIELAGQAVGLLAAAALAWSRAGVWAPVVGQIVWQSFTLIAALGCASVAIRPRFDAGHARRMLTFGAGLTASLRTWQLRTLVNPLLVGRFVGAEGVAFVALAIRIAESLGTFRLAAGRMAIAALARLQDNHDEFRGALERVLYLQVVTLGPLLCGFALCGPLVVRHVIGMRWMPSLAVYPFIAAGVLVNSVYNLQASGLFVIGRQWVVMRCYAAHVVLLAAGTLLLLPRLGLAAYGWAELLACAAYVLIHSGLARSVTIPYHKLVPWLAGCLAGLFLIPAGYTLLRMN
ncbi:MAG: oligosaccharide flippase family protein [Acidobacteriia bacterium]|nr:oligosaccharide flippase family protein [Terriglobia bacterium]